MNSGWQLVLLSNALGPNPSGVAASPNGCQSLQVTWTHRAPTPPLTLNHYRARYQTQGDFQQTVTTTSQGSYTLTGLAPATTYTVRVGAQTQLGYGYYCCEPNATTHNGEASSDACMHGVIRWLYGTLISIMSQQHFWYTVRMCSICAGVWQFVCSQQVWYLEVWKLQLLLGCKSSHTCEPYTTGDLCNFLGASTLTIHRWGE